MVLKKMDTKSPLENKVVLLVDDELDILETVSEELGMCLVHTAENFTKATDYLNSYTYDLVVLDIMGVQGFELLKISVAKNFPTVMLTAHALTPEALKKSIKLGAVSFMPKERMAELVPILEDMVQSTEKTGWKKLFGRLGDYFNERFGTDWKEKDQFLKEFIKELDTENAGNA